MQINFNDKQLFKGCDARRLKGVFVTDGDCAREIRKIVDYYNLDVYTPQIASKSIQKDYFSLNKENKLLWAQDYFTFIKDKAVLFDYSREFLQRVLRGCADGIKRQLKLEPLKSVPHIRGGNFYICDVNGTRKLLIAEDKLILPEEALKLFHDVDEICPIPKLDYHIDLFLRPLDNGNVLLADNKSTVNSLNRLSSEYKSLIENTELSIVEKEAYQKIIDSIKWAIKKFDYTQQYDKYKPQEKTEQIVESLKKYGFNPIRVPGNYYYLEGIKSKEKEQQQLMNFENNMQAIENYSKAYSPEFQRIVNAHIELQREIVKNDKKIGVELEKLYDNNFLNALAFKDINGKIVYVTNAPMLDKKLGITPEIEMKTGLSFRNIFIESISPYVDKENIHFISDKLTSKLFHYMGGANCIVAPIPA